MGATNCPETPRQKMITMMYLVYTAMLALNVSAEVIQGFKDVGNAMTKSNLNIRSKIDDTYMSFKAAYDNSPDKVRDKWEKAQEVRALAVGMENYIDSLSYAFVGELEEVAEVPIDPSDPLGPKRKIPLHNEGKAENPWPTTGRVEQNTNLDSVKVAMELGGFSWIQKLDNTHLGLPFFLGDSPDSKGDDPQSGPAIDLKKKIIEFKRRVKEILGEDSNSVTLGLDVESPRITKDGRTTSWATFTFNETVAGGVLVTLTQLKAEIMNAEFDVVNTLYRQVNKGDKNFSNIEMIAMNKSSYVMKGGTFESNIRVGAYDPNQRFRIQMGGQSSTSDETGTAVFRMTCNTVGPQTVKGTATLVTQDGEETYPVEAEFYVAEPSASVSLDNMNVLYAGIENPITATAPGMASKDVSVSIDAAAGRIAPAGEGKYNITPSPNIKNMEVSVYGMIDGQKKHLNTIRYRVKPIPDPVLKVGVYSNGEKKAARKDFTAGTTVIASKSKDFDFKIPAGSIRIKTMNITVGTKTCAPIENSGRLSDEVVNAISKAKRGDNLVIAATVQMPDGKPRDVDCVIKLAK